MTSQAAAATAKMTDRTGSHRRDDHGESCERRRKRERNLPKRRRSLAGSRPHARLVPHGGARPHALTRQLHQQKARVVTVYQTSRSLDWIRLTPAAVISAHALANEPLTSIARQASSTT